MHSHAGAHAHATAGCGFTSASLRENEIANLQMLSIRGINQQDRISHKTFAPLAN
jgi:hypothetical protein